VCVNRLPLLVMVLMGFIIPMIAVLLPAASMPRYVPCFVYYTALSTACIGGGSLYVWRILLLITRYECTQALMKPSHVRASRDHARGILQKSASPSLNHAPTGSPAAINHHNNNNATTAGVVASSSAGITVSPAMGSAGSGGTLSPPMSPAAISHHTNGSGGMGMTIGSSDDVTDDGGSNDDQYVIPDDNFYLRNAHRLTSSTAAILTIIQLSLFTLPHPIMFALNGTLNVSYNDDLCSSAGYGLLLLSLLTLVVSNLSMQL
jgi:hypothetical protein